MELAIDLELDLPKVWSCVAEQISSIFVESGGKIPLYCIKEITSPLLEADKAHLLVSEILKLLVKQMVSQSIVLSVLPILVYKRFTSYHSYLQFTLMFVAVASRFTTMLTTCDCRGS